MQKNMTIFENLSTLEQVQDMYSWFAQMRAEQPVWFDETSGCWHVFRYADVSRVITDSTYRHRRDARGTNR